MKEITIEVLKQMTDSEGLILQGCGGDLTEWIDGINGALTDENILLNGAKFDEVYTFKHNGLTNLLFSMDNMNSEKLDVGKLAMWRLQTHENFGGTWLSDYRVNALGMVENEQCQEPMSTQSM